MNRREALKRTALLFGVAVSPGTLTRALAELATDSAAPRYLTPSQYKVVAAMAERLLPASDTPGAIDAGVPQFIDVTYGLFISPADRNKLRTGLAHLDRMGFDALPAPEQDDTIRTIATTDEAPGKDWLRQFRWLTFNGYFTSAVAAKSGFIWDPIPGGYDGCMPLAKTDGIAFFE